MAKSRIYYPDIHADGDDGYTTTPTHYRIYKEYHGDRWPWCLDGVDDLGRYTEDVVRYATWAECIEALTVFATNNPLVR